jgi:hypothetical protein
MLVRPEGKAPPAVQDEPSYSSVAVEGPGPGVTYPPKPKPAVCVPAPFKTNLPVPRFPLAVH